MKKQKPQTKPALLVSVTKVRSLDDRKLETIAGGYCARGSRPVHPGDDW